MYSKEQGIKIEICELLKTLIDADFPEKKAEFHDLFYNNTLSYFAEFLKLDF